jgi:hypothetical protein
VPSRGRPWAVGPSCRGDKMVTSLTVWGRRGSPACRHGGSDRARSPPHAGSSSTPTRRPHRRGGARRQVSQAGTAPATISVSRRGSAGAAPAAPGSRPWSRTRVPVRGSSSPSSSVLSVASGEMCGRLVAADGPAPAGPPESGGASGTTSTRPVTSATISQCAGGLAGIERRCQNARRRRRRQCPGAGA